MSRLLAIGVVALIWASAGSAGAQTCQANCGIASGACHAGCGPNQPCHAGCEAEYQRCLRACPPPPTPPPTPPPPTPPPPANYWLQVRRFHTAELTAADADRILAAASTLLQTNDGAGDVACNVMLARNGEVVAFTTGDGGIDTPEEFNAVIALPGHVKLVNDITWCSRLGDFAGCSPMPGRSMIVTRIDAAAEGVLWAHEFGHNRGLCASTLGVDHRNEEYAVMNGTVTTWRRRVNAAECFAYRSRTGLAPLVEPVVAGPRASRKPGIREFVRQVFVHGVPYDEARGYAEEAVPVLLEMLANPAEEAAWANVAVTLGMIADEQAVEPLIAFIEAPGPARPSHRQYLARTRAVMALGYLLNKTGNPRVLDYLKAGLEPATWKARLAPAIAPHQSRPAERDQDLSKYAVLGLALSGRPEAADALRELDQSARSARAGTFARQIAPVVSSALNEHAVIAARGLETYYRSGPR